jgi:hypothetical protein
MAAGGQALAGTCNIQSARAPGEWTFVRVYDVDTGKIVLQRAIKGGVSYEVKVSGYRVRIDWKLPGGIKYETGPILACVDGNRVTT